MIYCTNCLDPSTRPKISFDKNGVCSSCNQHKKIKNEVDYVYKERVFREILKKFKKNKNSHFDCIIGVSGGKDSTRQALWLRDKFKLNPLLVCCTYPPEQLTEKGAENLSNLIELGFDTIVSAPSPQIWKKVLKAGFYNGNYLIGPELALYSSLPQIAIKYKINLIFWGASPAETSNELKTTVKGREWDGNNLRYSNTLKNCDTDWIKKIAKGNNRIIPYEFPSVQEFKKNNIQIVYLGWFWKKWSHSFNAKSAALNGLSIREDTPENTGDLYGAMALDEDWVIINQMIKYYKFGFGRATDYLNLDIRNKLISRETAIKIIEKYDGVCSEKYINSFCDYLEISKEEFWKVVSSFVNKDIFTINNNLLGKKYIPKFKVGIGL